MLIYHALMAEGAKNVLIELTLSNKMYEQSPPGVGLNLEVIISDIILLIIIPL